MADPHAWTQVYEPVVDALIADNPDKAEQAKANPGLLGWFVGRTMRATRGNANPVAVAARLREKLGIGAVVERDPERFARLGDEPEAVIPAGYRAPLDMRLIRTWIKKPLTDPTKVGRPRPGEIRRIRYRNWRGEVAVRTIVATDYWWGKTPYHREHQEFLTAYDVDKKANRDFACADVLDWNAVSADADLPKVAAAA